MKFSIQREVILKPLMQVIGVVERRQTLPVLANFLVTAKDNELSFTGTDLEVELIAKVNLSVEQPGEVTIPARKLVDICKALPDGTMLDIEIGSERATIRGGRSRFTLATLPATEALRSGATGTSGRRSDTAALRRKKSSTIGTLLLFRSGALP